MVNGEWHTVVRRKPYPPHWRHAPHPVSTTKPYIPYKPTYAQALGIPPRTTKENPKTIGDMANTKPFPPTNHSSASTTQQQHLTKAYYISPHSQLRFPPSPQFQEWRGRCFRCCRRGHTAATCRGLKKCGRCWGEGHTGTHCLKSTYTHAGSPSAMPRLNVPTNLRSDTAFDELIAGPYPSHPKPMPEERPAKSYCHVQRDARYYTELTKLENAVVLYAPEIEIDLTIDEVAECAVKTGLVQVPEVSIAVLTRSRYLISLPSGLTPTTFIEAIPDDVWKMGYTFSQWSPMVDASISIPQYKVLLDLIGISPLHYREDLISRAIGNFGVYLGTLDQDLPEEAAAWTVAVATHTLGRIPHQIVFVDGGMETVADVMVKNWIQTPLYSKEDMPKPTKEYTSPPCTSPVRQASGEKEATMITMTIGMLRELCGDRNPNTLPPDLRKALSKEDHQAAPPPLPPASTPATQIQKSQGVSATEYQHTRGELFTNLIEWPHQAGLMNTNTGAAPKATQLTPKKIMTRQTTSIPTDTGGADCPTEVLTLADKSIQAEEGSTRSSKRIKRQQGRHSCLAHGTSKWARFASARKHAIYGPLVKPQKAKPATGLKKNQDQAQPTLGRIKKPPIRTAPTVTGLIPTSRNKNTNQEEQIVTREREKKKGEWAAPLKKENSKPIQFADLGLDPNGYVEIRIDYEHRLAIAEACGSDVALVTKALQEDNADRNSPRDERMQLAAAQLSLSDFDDANLSSEPGSSQGLSDIE